MMPGRRTYRPIVLHDGTVIYLYPTIISSICPINVLYFPMDTQECRIMFGSWSHSGIEIDFQPKIPTGNITRLINYEGFVNDNYNCVPFCLFCVLFLVPTTQHAYKYSYER